MPAVPSCDNSSCPALLLPGKGTFPAEPLFGAEVLQEAAGWMWIVRILQPFIPQVLCLAQLPTSSFPGC